MRIAITGATGFIGRAIVARLTEAGHTCRCLYRSSSDRSGIDCEPYQLEWVLGDLASESFTELLTNCDGVVHAALDRPGTGFRGAEGDLVPFAQTNILGTLRLIVASRTLGVPRFVFLSTCAVHEEILDDRPLDETHPLWPKTHYGAHKGAIEMFVHSFGLGEGYDICALRPSGVYGVQHHSQTSKWYALIYDVVTGRPVECHRSGKEVHVDDVARAVEILLFSEGIAGQSYSCCDRSISEFEVATLAKELSGSRSVLSGESRRPKHEICTDKIRRLGMTFGGEATLRATVESLIDVIRARLSHDD